MNQSVKSSYSDHVRINDFAIRCFREIGDGDYVAARMAFRGGLWSQFLWSAEQAIEKYLKCILMLNRVPSNDLRHDIKMALDRVNAKLPFQLQLRKAEQELFDRVAGLEGDRYLIFSFQIDNRDFFVFDSLVWRLRQYCIPLDLKTVRDKPSKVLLLERVAIIEARSQRILERSADATTAIREGHLDKGKLEKILSDKKNPAYADLVWKNKFFSNMIGRKVRFTNGWSAVNSPLTLSPELADEAAKWMYIPKPILAEARAYVANPPKPVKHGPPKLVKKMPRFS